MISVAQAQAIVRANCAEIGVETIDLDRAYGRTLAATLMATRDQPPFAASAMDGFACPSSGEARDFVVVGESSAGRRFTRALQAGEAIRISTGAPVPEGAGGILIQEDAVVEGDVLRNARVTAGRHIRPRGGDFVRGQILLEKGRMLDPVAVALAASAGVGALAVARRPRITVMASGDEIVAPGQSARDDQVFESGAFAVCGLIEQWGGRALRGSILPDNVGAVTESARAAFAQCELLVLIGGASVGPHDHARAALAALGCDIRFDKVSVRPGKPTWFGVGDGGKVLGLPGNPASAIVCAALFLRPAIEALLGQPPVDRLHTGRLAAPLAANGARETYLRARVDPLGRLHAFADQDSSLLSIFAQSNALLLRAPNAPPAQAGDCASYLAIGN